MRDCGKNERWAVWKHNEHCFTIHIQGSKLVDVLAEWMRAWGCSEKDARPCCVVLNSRPPALSSKGMNHEITTKHRLYPACLGRMIDWWSATSTTNYQPLVPVPWLHLFRFCLHCPLTSFTHCLEILTGWPLTACRVLSHLPRLSFFTLHLRSIAVFYYVLNIIRTQSQRRTNWTLQPCIESVISTAPLPFFVSSIKQLSSGFVTFISFCFGPLHRRSPITVPLSVCVYDWEMLSSA